MNEKPRFRVVGGTEFRSNVDEDIPNIKDSTEITPYQLMMLFTKIVGRTPSDFARSINNDLLERYQLTVKSYTCGQLHNYLSHTDIWQHPTFTKAVLDEFVIRKDLGDYSPRDIAK